MRGLRSNTTKTVAYGGFLTPEEAREATTLGVIPEWLHKVIMRDNKFTTRLAKQTMRLEDPIAYEVVKHFLAVCGTGRNALAAETFRGGYTKELGACEHTRGIPRSALQTPESLFIAVYVAVVPNPPQYYIAQLAKLRPRNSRSRAEWEEMRAARQATPPPG